MRRVNVHGLFGIVALSVMIAVAYLKNWNIPWWYFVLAIVLYAPMAFGLSLVQEEEEGEIVYRFLWGCHIALLFLAGGMALGLEGFLINAGLFIVSVTAGLAVPFLLLRLHGLLGVFAILAIVGVAHLKNWDIPWLYFVLAVVLYSIGVFILSGAQEATSGTGDRTLFQLLLGCHIALLLLTAGMWLDFEGFFVNAGVFSVSIAIGLIIPFLVIRG